MRISRLWLKALVAAVVIGGFTALGMGAEPSTMLPDVGGSTNLVAKITEKLGLTADQKAKVEPILRESFEKRRAVLEKYRGQRGLRALRSLRQELRPIQKETDEKLVNVLTKEQWKQFQKMREEIRKQLRDQIRAHQNKSS
jgi:Spy/CpxP family protein refolding chaperone